MNKSKITFHWTLHLIKTLFALFLKHKKWSVEYIHLAGIKHWQTFLSGCLSSHCLKKQKVEVTQLSNDRMCVCVSQWVVSDSATPWTVAVYGIIQARILEWVAISFSRGSSWLRDQTQVSFIAGRFFTFWATR